MGDLVVWLGGLPRGVTATDIEKFFKGYGRIHDVQIRSSPKDVFSFVTFDDQRDGEEAVKDLNQREFLRTDHIVQLSRANRNSNRGGNDSGKSRRSPPARSRSRQRSPPRSRSRRSRSRSAPPRRNDSRDRQDPADEGIVIWLGGLPRGIEDEDITKFLKGYGSVRHIRVRSSPKDIFAFATFADTRDGKDAVKDLDQRRFLDSDNVVQMRESTTQRPQRDQMRYDQDSKPEKHDRRGGSVNRKSAGRFRIKLSYLPPDMSWGELKDIARTFGESIKYTNVFVERGVTCGIIEFVSKEDADRAIKALDNRRMDGHEDRIKASKEDDWD